MQALIFLYNFVNENVVYSILIENSALCDPTVPSVKVKEASVCVISNSRHKDIVLQQG